MKIIEQKIQGKDPEKKCEDGIVVTDDFIAVIDGSTAKTNYRHSRFRSNGRQAMRLTGKYIKKMPKGIDCHQFLIGVTNYIRREYKKSETEHLFLHPEDRLTCSAIIYSRLQRQLWLVGDCQCLIDGELIDNPKPEEAVHAAKRSEYAKKLLSQGTTVDQLLTKDASREYIMADMVESMKQQNVSYAVIDGFRIAEQFVKVITLDFQPHHIVMASDGYPLLRETLDESERLLRQQQENDPLNIDTFLACKAFLNGQDSFDDRSYIRFEI